MRRIKEKTTTRALAKRIVNKALAMSMILVFAFSFMIVPIGVNAKTVSKTATYKLSSKHCYLGLNNCGISPTTSNWSSSDTKIATVSSSGDSDGGHKVTFKKKGKVTISCKIKTTKGNWKKGNIHKWTLIIK